MLNSKQQGLTLIELVMVMVVLAIGLTGILRVIITMTSTSMTPLAAWQSVVVSDNVMQWLLDKPFPGFAACTDQLAMHSTTLCQYMGKHDANADQLLTQLSAIPKIPSYQVTITVSPYQANPQIAQITVNVSNLLGDNNLLTALKAPDQTPPGVHR